VLFRSLKDLQSTLAESASAIQIWWTKQRLSVLRDFTVTLSGAKKDSFEDLVPKLQSKDLIRTADKIIDRVRKMKLVGKWKNPSRVFLSAYMIATHPKDAMPHFGAPEEEMQKSAEAMIIEFELLVAGSGTCNIRQLAIKFLESLGSYYTNFEAWKAADTKKIVDGMISHWLELEKLWLSVRHSQVDAESNWHPKIASQQKSILQKIAAFGPPAIRRLKREQKKLIEELGIADEIAKPELADVDSEDALSSAYESDVAATPIPSIYSTSPERFPANSFMNVHDSVKMSRRESSSQGSSPGSGLRRGSSQVSSVTTSSLIPLSFEKETPKMPLSPSISMLDLESVAAPVIPPSTLSSSSSSEFGAFLSNEQLARELVRNPEFELKPAKKSALEQRVTKMAKKAFFDAARQEFSQGVYVNYVPGLLEDIKNQFLSMVSPKGKIHTEITEHLDIELIRQQIEHKVFKVEQCTAYIISKMTQLCAPVRDQSIRQIATLSPDLAAMFEACLDILEDMKMDLVNYKLKSIAPMLKSQAVEYEMGKFKEAVEAGQLGHLEHTRAWLSTAYESLSTIAKARNPEGVIHPENKIRFEDVYTESLMSLIFSPKALDPSSVPETLRLDASYIFSLQNEAQLVTIVAALVMLSKNAVGTMRRDRTSTLLLRDRLFALLKDDESEEVESKQQVTVDNLSHEIIRVCNSSLEKSGGNLDAVLPEETQTLIKNMVERTLSTKDTLFSMISRRVQGLCRGQLNTGLFKSVTGGSLASAGLDIVEVELESLSKKVYMLSKHNREVHAQWYDAILKSIIAT